MQFTVDASGRGDNCKQEGVRQIVILVNHLAPALIALKPVFVCGHPLH